MQDPDWGSWKTTSIPPFGQINKGPFQGNFSVPQMSSVEQETPVPVQTPQIDWNKGLEAFGAVKDAQGAVRDARQNYNEVRKNLGVPIRDAGKITDDTLRGVGASQDQIAEFRAAQSKLDATRDNRNEAVSNALSGKAGQKLAAGVMTGGTLLGGEAGLAGSATLMKGLSDLGSKGSMGNIIAGGAAAAAGALENLTGVGDKNFGAQSQAIDAAVHGVSGALMQSGNPIAMGVGAALEGANALTKVAGQNVQGYNVKVDSSGYSSDMLNQESSASRDFGMFFAPGDPLSSLASLGSMRAVRNKLAKRNEKARMALDAAEIASDQMFEQEARASSVDNILMNNQIALSGGLDTDMLAG